MARFVKMLCTTAVLAAVALLALPNRARASFELALWETTTGGALEGSVVGSGVVSDATGNAGVTYSGNVGATGNTFSVFIAVGSSNSPGSSANALAQEGTFTITNNSSTTQVLNVAVSAQDFTTPSSPSPLTVLDTVSGSLVSGTVSGSVVSYADAENNLFATTTSLPNGIGNDGAFASSGLDLNFSASGSSKSISANGSALGFTTSGPYSLTFVESFTLSAGGSLTLTGGNVQVVTPAPSTAVLALSGLPLLGLGLWLRRRKTRKVPVAA